MMEVKLNLLNEMKCVVFFIFEVVLEYCFDILQEKKGFKLFGEKLSLRGDEVFYFGVMK